MTNRIPIKIAFVTPGYDPQDMRRGSGTFYYLSKEIMQKGFGLFPIGPLDVQDPIWTRNLRFFTNKVLKRRYLTYLDPWIARARGILLGDYLASIDYDVILTNDHGIAAEVDTEKPVVLYTDVMLPNRWIGPQHSAFRSAPYPVSLIYQHTIRKALSRVSLAIFPAAWQLSDALEYRVPHEKLAVIPFGANIPDPGPKVAEQRDFKVVFDTKHLDILFVGKDWQRKGGEVAVNVTARLRKVGLDAVLHVVGAEVKNAPGYVIAYGLLDKSKQIDWILLDRLYRECQIFLFPSSSEGSAIVPREASAYGMPTVGYRIEGLKGSVVDGVNGWLIDLNNREDAFVNVVQDWLANPVEYKRMAMSSRKYYETNANWELTVSRILEMITQLSSHKN